ncbi:hypothetical protein JCM10212_006646 [Sporobolomyces blumeae]
MSQVEKEGFLSTLAPTPEQLDRASQLTVFDREGSPVPLGSLIHGDKGGRSIVIFIRHWYCGLCQVRLRTAIPPRPRPLAWSDELPSRLTSSERDARNKDFISYLTSKISQEDLAQHRLKLSVIGCGDWELIKPYVQNLGSPFDFYADPTKKTYEALGMTLRTLDMGSKNPEYQKTGVLGNIFASITRAFKIGGIFGKNSGDIKQLGGEFVFENGQPIYTHRMENTRGHAPLAELFQAAGLPPPQ